MSEWIEYTGSDEQNRDILGSKADVLFMYSNGVHRLRSSMFTGDWKHRTLTHYLICQPHPYADLIDIWRLSGCQVWYKHKLVAASGECSAFHLPFSYPDICEYSLTPFED